ncbi:MAG: hypothetical protein D6730_05475 [Bacteroidetes bacterium]|nr:MAG: hypothetical protein D6730_05475 [Bacteroidota bacterium]
MNNSVVEIITKRFEQVGNPAQIPLLRYSQRGKSIFQARLCEEGIIVDNLPEANALLPWEVFTETVKLLEQQGGKARKGSSVNKLGSEKLPLNSIEGHIAHVVFQKQPGDTVLRRISPITGILRWARICDSKPGVLVLKGKYMKSTYV